MPRPYREVESCHGIICLKSDVKSKYLYWTGHSLFVTFPSVCLEQWVHLRHCGISWWQQVNLFKINIERIILFQQRKAHYIQLCNLNYQRKESLCQLCNLNKLTIQQWNLYWWRTDHCMSLSFTLITEDSVPMKFGQAFYWATVVGNPQNPRCSTKIKVMPTADQLKMVHT